MSTTATALTILLGLITFLSVLGAGARWLYRFARRHETRMQKLDQLDPNGGDSLRDQVDDTRADVAEIKQHMFDQEKRQGRIEARQDHQSRVLDEILLELRRRVPGGVPGA